jgi:hypothetical protein
MNIEEGKLRSINNLHKLGLVEEYENGLKIYRCMNKGCDASLIINNGENGILVTGSTLYFPCINWESYYALIRNYEIAKAMIKAMHGKRNKMKIKEKKIYEWIENHSNLSVISKKIITKVAVADIRFSH